MDNTCTTDGAIGSPQLNDGYHLPTKTNDNRYHLVERRVDEKRGRHLVATEPIQKGQLLFTERPLLSLQSIGNSHSGALVCRCCRAFIGGPDLALGIAAGTIDREHAFEEYQKLQSLQGHQKKSCIIINDDTIDTWNHQELLVPCRNQCGELFCSKACEDLMWSCCGHNLLCTGLISDDDNGHLKESSINHMDKNGYEYDENDNDLQIGNNSTHPLLQYKVNNQELCWT